MEYRISFFLQKREEREGSKQKQQRGKFFSVLMLCRELLTVALCVFMLSALTDCQVPGPGAPPVSLWTFEITQSRPNGTLGSVASSAVFGSGDNSKIAIGTSRGYVLLLDGTSGKKIGEFRVSDSAISWVTLLDGVDNPRVVFVSGNVVVGLASNGNVAFNVSSSGSACAAPAFSSLAPQVIGTTLLIFGNDTNTPSPNVLCAVDMKAGTISQLHIVGNVVQDPIRAGSDRLAVVTSADGSTYDVMILGQTAKLTVASKLPAIPLLAAKGQSLVMSFLTPLCRSLTALLEASRPPSASSTAPRSTLLLTLTPLPRCLCG